MESLKIAHFSNNTALFIFYSVFNSPQETLMLSYLPVSLLNVIVNHSHPVHPPEQHGFHKAYHNQRS